MKKYEFKYFTDIETPETDEIEELYIKQKNIYKYTFLIEITVLLFPFILIAAFSNNVHIDILLIVFSSLLITVITPTIIIYIHKTSYLRKKLKIAKLNDQVRHEERIRIKERKDFEKLLEETNTNCHNLKQTFKEVESIISRNTNTEHIIKKLPSKPPQKN